MDANAALRDPAVEEFNTETLLKNAAKQARDRRYEDFLIVDVDAHHYETESLSQIVEFMEDPVLRHLAGGSGRRGVTSNLIVASPGFQDLGGRINRYRKRASEKVPEKPHRDVTLT